MNRRFLRTESFHQDLPEIEDSDWYMMHTRVPMYSLTLVKIVLRRCLEVMGGYRIFDVDISDLG